jgi:hypothetical protein
MLVVEFFRELNMSYVNGCVAALFTRNRRLGGERHSWGWNLGAFSSGGEMNDFMESANFEHE